MQHNFKYTLFDQTDPVLGELIRMRFSYDDGNILDSVLFEI